MRLYGYARVSTDEQSDSIEVQQHRLNELVSQTPLEFGGLYVDVDVSAYKVFLKDRPQGKLLWDAVGQGDMVAVTAQDRLFRDPVDAILTFRSWRRLGVSIYDMGKGRVIESADDETMFQLLAVLSGAESRKQGERRRAINQNKKKRGEPYSCTLPWGWARKDGKYVPDMPERALGDQALLLRRQGVTYPGIALAWLKKGYRKKLRGGKAGWFHVSDVRSLCLAAAAGYPRISRGAWKCAATAAKLCAEVAGASQPASVA